MIVFRYTDAPGERSLDTLDSTPYKEMVHLLNITSTEMTNLKSIHWEDGLTIAVSTNKVISDGGFGRSTGFIAIKDSSQLSGWLYIDLLENDIISVRNRFYYKLLNGGWVVVSVPYTPQLISNKGIVNDIKGYTGVPFVEDTLKLTITEPYKKYAVLSSEDGISSGYGGFIATYHNDPNETIYYQKWTFQLLMYNDHFYSERHNIEYVYIGTGFTQSTDITNSVSLISSDANINNTETRQYDPFFSNTMDEYRKIPRSLLAPFFKFNEKTPNIITPGGYKGVENFKSSIYKETNIYLNPGFCIIDETLIEFKKDIVLNVTSANDYLDGYGYQSIGSTLGTVYAVACYNKNNSKLITGMYATSEKDFPYYDYKSAYIKLISDPSTFYYNSNMFCFLYSITVNVNSISRRITSINSISYKDSTISYMKRKGPDYGV